MNEDFFSLKKKSFSLIEVWYKIYEAVYLEIFFF